MNEQLLNQCLNKIEGRLEWVNNSLWSHQDFELLSERIFTETKVRLSSSTLKRVWGKVNHQGIPSISTLNALAKFAGYADWSEFKNNERIVERPAPQKHLRSMTRLVSLGLLLAGVTFITLFAFHKTDKKIYSDAEKMSVAFSSLPVTKGLPNSVVFKYNFGSLEVNHSQIQQSWNKELTFSINPHGKEATGIYYYPGYFRAKLLADNQVLKEHDLYLMTEGWMGTVDQGQIPVYFSEQEFKLDGKLQLSSTDRLPSDGKPIEISFHYFSELDSARGDNFTYEARFRSSNPKSGSVCKNISVLVHGTEAVFLTPFCISGCISDLNLLVAGREVSGKTNDLSAFGFNPPDWIDFKLHVSDGEASYFINNHFIRKERVDKSIGRLVGFRFRFSGEGELDYVKLFTGRHKIFEEDFD